MRYPMKFVSQRTGLSPHVLRVWERRYHAVQPDRSEGNRRLYSEEEIVRLELLARLTAAGQSIKQIAGLPLADLSNIATVFPPAKQVGPKAPSKRGENETLLEEAWRCIIDLAPSALRAVLEKAEVILGCAGFVNDLIVPLLERIGESWETGELSIAEEHAASAVIKEVLLLSSRPYARSTTAPNFVVTTPAGQLHELGAVLVACAARRLGWEVTYLGPSLPAPEIARAVVRNRSLAVGLSIVYPGDDPQLPDDLRRLHRSLPGDVKILIGGRCARSYVSTIKEIGATLLPDLGALKAELEPLRRQGLPL